MTDGDPHDEIELLEARIEQLEARIESCRKFVLAARIAMAGGGVVLAALLFGIISFEPTVMAAAFAAVLGGIVVGGSNNSTAKEAKAELIGTEARRAALIGQIDLRLVAGRDTPH
jgi:outer membrane murein-binding lipoprotein Lpp